MCLQKNWGAWHRLVRPHHCFQDHNISKFYSNFQNKPFNQNLPNSFEKKTSKKLPCNYLKVGYIFNRNGTCIAGKFHQLIQTEFILVEKLFIDILRFLLTFEKRTNVKILSQFQCPLNLRLYRAFCIKLVMELLQVLELLLKFG